MPDHTPGPWTAESREPDDDGWDVWDDPDLPKRAVAHDIFNEANARLIAAAPDLLAALEEAERYIEYADREKPVYHAPVEADDVLRATRAAIAKAKGDTDGT